MEEALAGPGGLRVVPPGTVGGGGSPPPSIDPACRGAAAASAGGAGRVTVPVGVGPGSPFGVDVVAGGIRFLVRGGWSLVVGGVWGQSARVLPAHALVLLVHGGLWSAGVGWWAVVVVGVVLVVVMVRPPVVVALVVVGMVVRVWSLDPLWIFRSPQWGWGVGHRAQSLGPCCLVGSGGGLGAGHNGDRGRGVPRPWVGLACRGGGL